MPLRSSWEGGGLGTDAGRAGAHPTNATRIRRAKRQLSNATKRSCSHIDAIMTLELSDVQPRMRATLAVVVALFSGCAESTGIRPAGLDIYTASEHFAAGRRGSLTAEQTVLNEASAFCIQQGRAFLPLDMLTPARANPPDQTGYSVTFRCVPPADLALPRASGSRPDAIIDTLRELCAAPTVTSENLPNSSP